MRFMTICALALYLFTRPTTALADTLPPSLDGGAPVLAASVTAAGN